jgi:hypothetical protein
VNSSIEISYGCTKILIIEVRYVYVLRALVWGCQIYFCYSFIFWRLRVWLLFLWWRRQIYISN